MKKRREVEVFSLSFLDSICCGFGAIILIFVLTIGPIKKKTNENEQAVNVKAEVLQSKLKRLELANEAISEQIEALNGDSTEMLDSGALKRKGSSLEKEIAQTEQSISKALDAYADAKASTPEIPPERTTEPKEEMQKIEEETEGETIPSSPVGVPTDNDHLVFLIDTSGSMRDPFGRINMLVIRQIERTLDAYPQIKSLQVLDTSGNYILSGTARSWVPDTRSTRNRIVEALRSYRIESVSDPTPGMVRFFRDYRPHMTPDKSIGIYIFGDEFPKTASSVLTQIEKLNPVNPNTGKRYVVINAVGFPFRTSGTPRPNQTGYKYANLMRELTFKHDGAFMVVRP